MLSLDLQKVQNLMPHDYIKSRTVYTVVQQYILVDYCLLVQVCVCVCVFSSHSFWTSIDIPAGVTQGGGNTGFSIHLLSTVLVLIFLARRIQPLLSLVDREVEFCVVVVVVVVIVFTLKTVLTSIQYPSLSYSSRQRNEFPWSHANPK